MEDLWRMQKIQYQMSDWADRAEYAKLLRRFREEEERYNRDRLLYGDEDLKKP